MAGDTVEPLYAHQLASVLVSADPVFLSITRCGFHIGTGVGNCEVSNKELGVSFAEIGHACGHIRPHCVIAAQHLVQCGLSELCAHAGQ